MSNSLSFRYLCFFFFASFSFSLGDLSLVFRFVFSPCFETLGEDGGSSANGHATKRDANSISFCNGTQRQRERETKKLYFASTAHRPPSQPRKNPTLKKKNLFSFSSNPFLSFSLSPLFCLFVVHKFVGKQNITGKKGREERKEKRKRHTRHDQPLTSIISLSLSLGKNLTLLPLSSSRKKQQKKDDHSSLFSLLYSSTGGRAAATRRWSRTTRPSRCGRRGCRWGPCRWPCTARQSRRGPPSPGARS